MQQAPFHQLPDDPGTPATAFRVAADDGIGLRMALWRSATAGTLGSVLLFPGRTEFVEKYGPFVQNLITTGYDVLGIDWRGQGMSDRLQSDPRPGHIGEFADYQRDVVEMVVAADKLDLPRPWHLLAHSMGGCIGLAALHDDLPVVSATFSAPMWGINLYGVPRFVPQAIGWLAGRLGRGGHPFPGAGARGTYYVDEKFRTNLLTSDVDQWARSLREAAYWPELTIGGASCHWLRAALAECARLAALPSPDLPTLIALGSREAVVSTAAIRDRAGRTRNCTLLEIPEARHEVIMETPDCRRLFLQQFLAHIGSAAAEAAAQDT
ncbi:alpha/beta fold hydrolase [Paracoccus sp. (in: a-proteobacteria)]|uniref:alpha/beta fold hydrolase n=1 Tax=Paracoccus sp. TaxID=267 RepID=UPI003A874EF7